MNELKIRADALRWYIAEKRDDPRIPDPYTDEGQARLRVLCVYQASMEPDWKDDEFQTRFREEMNKLKPKGAGNEWNLAQGWHNPGDKFPLWPPYWESVYRDICRDTIRMKREGFNENARRNEKVLSAIEEAFPEMVEHMIHNAGVKRP
jgi:hypothetical protein